MGQHCNTWVAGCGEVVGEQGTARGWESEQGKLAACHGQGVMLPPFFFLSSFCLFSLRKTLKSVVSSFDHFCSFDGVIEAIHEEH
jgi:hypothetical protein